MNRNSTLNVWNELYEIVSCETELPINECEEIVKWSYNKVKEATLTNNSVEISGFGKLLISPNKTKNRIKRCIDSIERFNKKKEMGEDVQKYIDVYIEKLQHYKWRMRNEQAV